MLYLALAILGFAATTMALPYFRGMICEAGFVRKNYREDMIPVSMGLSFLPFILMNCGLILYFAGHQEIAVYAFAVMAMSFAGIVDDIMGSRESSGFKGHFKALFKGKLTTGAFKALFGGFVALFVSVSLETDFLKVVLDTLVIALSTNFFNLMDLRPGRAIKVYFASYMLLVPFVPQSVRLMIVGSASPVIGYFPQDIKAKAMMGDAGSNVLGVSVGIAAAMGLGLYPKAAVLLFLVIVHLVAEKYSITKIIEGNRLLNFIDRLGR